MLFGGTGTWRWYPSRVVMLASYCFEAEPYACNRLQRMYKQSNTELSSLATGLTLRPSVQLGCCYEHMSV